MFNWEGDLPAGTPEGLTLAGEEVDGVFEHGFIMYGVPVGSDAYCRHKLMEVAKRIVSDGQKTLWRRGNWRLEMESDAKFRLQGGGGVEKSLEPAQVGGGAGCRMAW